MPVSFEFKWVNYRDITPAQSKSILHIYEYVFEHDIGIVFDGSLDADFATPLKYYAPEVRGAYGIVVQTHDGDGDGGDGAAAEEPTIVGTVGLRAITIPDSCYTGVGSEMLPPRNPASGDAATAAAEAAAAGDSRVCELKRMFLLPCARGQGLSKTMLNEAVNKAKSMGYEAMVLDTRKRLEAANYLYEKVGGFVEFTDYNGNPRPDRFMIRRL